MYFASDNWAGAAPEILESIREQAAGFADSYGVSPVDRAVEAQFNEVFEREVAVFFVGTGTAANALALASVNKPGGAVFCHRESHIVDDECGAVEFQTGGARLFQLDGPAGKLDPEALESSLARFMPGFVHAGQPMAVSVTQATEAGGVYSLEELRALSAIARKNGLPLHMDGARFANALVHLDVSPAEMTWRSGVDILSFGGTKNGCICAEALVFFDPAMAQNLPFMRKRAGHLFSKSRFFAAQFQAYLQGGLWLELARHANEMAARLRTGLAGSTNGREAWPTDGNEIFAVLTKRSANHLRSAGAVFYNWPKPHAVNLHVGEDEVLVRLVTSFATTVEHVDGFIGHLGA